MIYFDFLGVNIWSVLGRDDATLHKQWKKVGRYGEEDIVAILGSASKINTKPNEDSG